nr:hypothetical protein [Accumulibacter sp.]
MRRLILSFIGTKDLEFLDPPTGSTDLSPIVRLLLHLGSCGGLVPARTCLWFFDDLPGDERRLQFCKDLTDRLPSIGLDGLRIRRLPLSLDEPTQLDRLYAGVWDAIPLSGSDGFDEYVFHLSSGTWAMQTTMVLAASCLPLPRVRLFETSRQQGAKEIQLPYLLALRAKQGRDRQATRQRLDKTAHRLLLTNTVVDDPLAQAAYASLYQVAKRKTAQRLLIKGPTGSGKWHAAQQFVRWRKCASVECSQPGALADLEVTAGQTLLLRWLDGWNGQALAELTSWSDRHRDVSVVATWRTDQPPVAGLETLSRHGLRGAAHVDLPSLGSRSDVVMLAEALARRHGILKGKLFERFQFDLLTDVYARNLHDLATLLATTANQSASPHPGRDGHQRAVGLLEADELRATLRSAFDALLGLDFGPGQPTLPE